MDNKAKEAMAKKLEAILNKQEYVLQYIDMLNGLSGAGGILTTTSSKFLNEIQLSIAGVKIAERQ